MSRLLILLFIFTGCSTTRFERTTAPENDVLIVETTMRYDGKRLNEWAAQNGVLGEATQLCQSGKTDEAQEQLKSILNSKRKDPSYWMVVGNCYWHASQGSKAEYFYRLALGLGQANSQVKAALHNNLGLLYIQRQLYPEAKAELEKANESLTARYNLAQIALLMGDTRSARAYLAQLYRTNRRDPDVLASMAVAHLLEGNTKLAIKVLKEIPANESARQDVAFYLAMGSYLSGDMTNAQEQLNKVDRADKTVSRLSDMAGILEKLVTKEVEAREAAAEAAQKAAKAKAEAQQG